MALTLSDIGQLGPSLSTDELAGLTGVCKRIWYEAARGEIDPPFDIQPIRVNGRRLRWPTASVLRALDIDPESVLGELSTSTERGVA